MKVYEQLLKIQKELKAPKNQKNNFGNYNYRSCEDILEAVKPMLGECTLTITDEVVLLGDRYYVKATATLFDGETKMSNSAYAREAETKKGMDESQITGAASSYARKYALNGLFAIDDTKDADTQDNREETKTPSMRYFTKDENGVVRCDMHDAVSLLSKKGEYYHMSPDKTEYCKGNGFRSMKK